MLKITTIEEYLSVESKVPYDLKNPEGIPTIVVRWDQAEELFWTLRLAEFYGDCSESWGYQPNAAWHGTGSLEMSYKESPPSKREDIKGKCSAVVRVNEDRLDFTLTLKNESNKAWRDCWTWICLIHRWARAFQANCELPAGTPENPWVPAVALPAPMERWLKWCGVEKKKSIAEQIGKTGGTRWQPHILARECAVRAWRIQEAKQQFIEFSSPDAIILGWSHWPCTDMGLYFGSLEPGQSSSVAGALNFYKKTFKPI